MNELNYIAELTQPTANFNSLIGFEEYKQKVETMRMEFIKYVSTYTNENTIKGIKEEITNAQEKIRQRGYLSIDNNSLNALLYVDKHNNSSLTMYYCKMVDSFLMESSEKTITYINRLLTENKEIENATSTEVAQTKQEDKEWLNIKETAKFFNIPYNNLKNRQWRKKHNFPAKQDGAYAKITCNKSEVAKWLNQKQ